MTHECKRNLVILAFLRSYTKNVKMEEVLRCFSKNSRKLQHVTRTMPYMYPERPQIYFMHMRVVSAYMGMMASAHRVRPDAIFHNLEKLWRGGGTKPVWGKGTVPRCPPLTTGLRIMCNTRQFETCAVEQSSPVFISPLAL